MSPQVVALASENAPREPRAIRVERLFTQHHRTVYRWALRYGAGDSAFAEDIVQEVFVRLLRSIDGLNDDQELARWLHRVTANCCLSVLRRRRVGAVVLQTLKLATPVGCQVDERMAARHALRRIFSTLQAMPPKERVVFSMLYLDDMPQSDIAETLGYSKGYISKLVRRAHERIEKMGW